MEGDLNSAQLWITMEDLPTKIDMELSEKSLLSTFERRRPAKDVGVTDCLVELATVPALMAWVRVILW